MHSFNPAISLTRGLPQGIDADILLLGVKDVRDILYTVYANKGFPERKIDITVCESNQYILGMVGYFVP